METKIQTKKSNPMAAFTARRQKMSASKDGGGKRRFRRSVFATVTCDKHGIEIKGKNGKEVRCAPPFTKRQRHAGCPVCSAERAHNKEKA